ncbi:hypothetical protein CKAH01_17577 [Colletotrichum kahawae]|uniref:Uncharacterized protein n=1 Tax=Colletotrichum kahawae TaxID=34407 RepID=A0AAD9Y9G3_COLKA|nr:hypothetical protein CKAH01_17577 [Colletotrichum kahawae]
MGAPEIFTAVATGLLAFMAVVTAEMNEVKEKNSSLQAEMNEVKEKNSSLQAEMNEVKEENRSLQAEMDEVKEAAVKRQGVVDMTAALLADHLGSCAHLHDTDTDEEDRGPFPAGQ